MALTERFTGLSTSWGGRIDRFLLDTHKLEKASERLLGCLFALTLLAVFADCRPIIEMGVRLIALLYRMLITCAASEDAEVLTVGNRDLIGVINARS